MFEYELETGLDSEYECEFANEYESEEFLPLLLPALKMAAPMAIRAIGGLMSRRRRRGQRELELMGEYEAEYEGEYEGDAFIGNLLRGLGGALLGEGEYEFENEYEVAKEPSSEYELMMEHLGYRAAHTESEAEAEAFLGALASMATRLVPKISSALPSIIQGVTRIGRALHKSPTTRKLLQTVPTILKGTVKTMARQVDQGQPLTKTMALRSLAGNVANVLDDPRKVNQVMRKSHRAQHRLTARTGGKRRPALA